MPFYLVPKPTRACQCASSTCQCAASRRHCRARARQGQRGRTEREAAQAGSCVSAPAHWHRCARKTRRSAVSFILCARASPLAWLSVDPSQLIQGQGAPTASEGGAAASCLLACTKTRREAGIGGRGMGSQCARGLTRTPQCALRAREG